MADNRQKTLVDTLRDYTNDADLLSWEDNNRDLLHVKATFEGTAILCWTEACRCRFSSSAEPGETS